MISIAKLDPVGEARMRVKPEREKGPWSRHAQTPLHQFYKGSRGGVVLVSEFQAKPVGLMLEVPAERHVNRLVHKAKKTEGEHTQRQRGKIRRCGKPPS